MAQHNRFRIGSLLFGLLGIAAAVLTIRYVSFHLNDPPKILDAPESAAACTDALMDNICQGNFEVISQYLYGSPNLQLSNSSEDTVQKILWDAYLESTSYEFLGDCYATESGLARDLHFTCLDISSVTDELRTIAQEIFYTRLENAEDQAMIYDEHNNYREDFIQEVVVAAVEQSLAENARFRESTIALQLSYYQGQWLVVVNPEFMDAIWGDIAG